MLDIGIFAPFGTAHEKNIAFCTDSDVHFIIHSASELAKDGGEVPDADDLAGVAETYRAGGVMLSSLRPPRTSLAALKDPEVRGEEMAVMTGIVKAMGKAGIPFSICTRAMKSCPKARRSGSVCGQGSWSTIES